MNLIINLNLIRIMNVTTSLDSNAFIILKWGFRTH